MKNINNANFKYSNNSRNKFFSKEDFKKKIPILAEESNNKNNNNDNNIILSKINSLTTENKNLKENLLAKNQEKYRIDSENMKLLENYNNLKKNIDKSNKNNDILSQEINNLKLKLNGLENYKNEILHLKLELKKKDNIISQINQNPNNKEMENNYLYKIDVLNDNIKILESNIENLYENYNNDIKEKNDNIEVLEKIIKNNDINYNIYQTEIKNKDLEIEKLLKKLDIKKEKIKNLKNLPPSNQNQIINAENNTLIELSHKEKEVSLLTGKVLELNNIINQLKEINETYISELEKQENDEEAKNYIDFLEKENIDLRDQLLDIKDESAKINNLKKDNENMKNQLKLLETKLLNEKKQNNLIKNDISANNNKSSEKKDLLKYNFNYSKKIK